LPAPLVLQVRPLVLLLPAATARPPHSAAALPPPLLLSLSLLPLSLLHRPPCAPPSRCTCSALRLGPGRLIAPASGPVSPGTLLA
jgi:hypothetical protein